MSLTPAPRKERSLAGGAAAITVATAVSRVTGFVRVMVVAAAMGTTFLANTYQTSNTAPNVLFELVAGGVLTSLFVPTFVEYLVRGESQEGWDAANALTSVALAGLIFLSGLLALTAPLVMRLLTIGVANDALRNAEVGLGATFLRLFAPQVIFYGAGMIMSAALNAHRRFAMPAIAPIFNNAVVIAVYLTYAVMRGSHPPVVSGITTAETFVLGAGTTLGVIAMTVVLVPGLRQLGWRFRFRFELKHPAVRRAVRMGFWALGYAGGYQAGLIVVLLLANRVRGGVAAYQWAYTFFYLPHALFAIPIFNVLFTAMSEHAAKREVGAFLGRLREGLGMLMFLLVPIAALMIATAGPLATITLQYGVMNKTGAALVARVIQMFALGLPAYSAFLTFTRAFYALGDAKTPALLNGAAMLASSALGTLFFFVLPSEWSVAGLALGHSLGVALGTGLLVIAFERRVGAGDRLLAGSLRRALFWGLPALGAMALVEFVLPQSTRLQALLDVVLVAAAGAVVYGGGMLAQRTPEMSRLILLVRRLRGSVQT
jgi:putative peptidoglycan lipid II flippase